MRRLTLVVVLAIVAGFPGSAAMAGDVSNGSGGRASLTAVASELGPTPDADPGPDPTCWWTPLAADEELAEMVNDFTKVFTLFRTVMFGEEYRITLTYYSDRGVLHRYNADTDRYEYNRYRVCKEGYEQAPDEIPAGTYEWVPAFDPDPVLILDRTKEVTTYIDPPVVELSPPASAGAPVNLGLWLAIEPDGPYVAEARLGPRTWARRTATLVDTTFEFGNGDSVTCPGTGTPLPAGQENTVDEGPCGYTYTDVGDVGAELTVTVTARWGVTWELSDGRSGRDADLTTSTSFPYDVYEIQTVGN